MVNLNFYRLMYKGLIVAQDVVHNPEGMQAYYERTPAVIEHFGGRVIAFTTDADCREGDGFLSGQSWNFHRWTLLVRTTTQRITNRTANLYAFLIPPFQ